MTRLSSHHSSPEKIFSSLLREVIFGLNDGMVSTLGSLVGIAIGSQNRSIVILSGFVIIVVESISMAAGTFLSSKSEKEAEKQVLQKEENNIENDPKGEKKDLRSLYRRMGFQKIEIDILLKRVTKNKKLWLMELANHHFGINDISASSGLKSVFMGSSYILGGFIPLFPYMFFSISNAVAISVIGTVCALFGVGALKTLFTKLNWFRSGFEMTAISILAAGAGYVIAKVVSSFFDFSILPLDITL